VRGCHSRPGSLVYGRAPCLAGRGYFVSQNHSARQTLKLPNKKRRLPSNLPRSIPLAGALLCAARNRSPAQPLSTPAVAPPATERAKPSGATGLRPWLNRRGFFCGPLAAIFAGLLCRPAPRHPRRRGAGAMAPVAPTGRGFHCAGCHSRPLTQRARLPLPPCLPRLWAGTLAPVGSLAGAVSFHRLAPELAPNG
jgi:hypothetical protein